MEDKRLWHGARGQPLALPGIFYARKKQEDPSGLIGGA